MLGHHAISEFPISDVGEVVVVAEPDAICFEATAAPALAFDGEAGGDIKYETDTGPAIEFDGEVGCY